ncbi:tripartite tricarboxylate transporter substrate binding protein [Salicibibacter cibarius]|uniref:Tripartite tricarboxylate transporter substrate binding protein n=1 Tax=Salicibibacter cibarius TaxID=2743000 RepID=A0A7T7CDA8_9BACI|nr:tripartite tricarboxylate transporter substrate binding protein [Salicibibacter cibarius]QQK77793.1 tripartite tricarboxylate transporter substrate binding protein [Salicibibacter cibarius]
MKKRTWILFFACTVIISGCSQSSSSPEDDYPSDTIEIITPFAPGGSTDTAARIFESHLSENLPNNQNVIVDNRPGGQTTVGMTAIQNAEPDGYTIGFASNSPITTQPHLSDTEYDYDSFEPIIQLVDIPQVLMANHDSELEDFDDLLEFMEENPGDFTYSTPGNGSISDIAMLSFLSEAELEAEAIPYESGGDAVTAALGGEVDAVSTFQGNVDADQVNTLVQFSEETSEMNEGVPTLEEGGIDTSTEAYIGIVAPEGVPQEIVDTLHDAFEQTLEDPEVQEQLLDLHYDISYGTGEEFGQNLEEDYFEHEELLREAGQIE